MTGPNAWGYWALEVAALVVLYGGEDAALRTCPHYPSDLVDFARR
nr:PoNe immunity protein domain-containing protein [Stenotrophomonas maltophilia]